jgi:hypothetical protein
MTLKKNMSSLWFFGGFSQQSFNSFFAQINMGLSESCEEVFHKYKHCIDLPILRVKYEDAYDLLCKIVKAKTAYEQIRDGMKTGRREERMEILELLELPNFKCVNLHTLILFDDATTLFSDLKNPLNNLLLKNRYNKFTYFLNIHNFSKRDVPMTLKKNMSSLWFFGGFSQQSFNSFFAQINMGLSESCEEVFQK